MSNYPMGAEYDPRAPWNQPDTEMCECPACKGYGYLYYAYDLRKEEDIECTAETYNLLPETEEEAVAKGQHYIQGEKWPCTKCDGTGEITEDDDYEDDFRDYYREREYDRLLAED